MRVSAWQASGQLPRAPSASAPSSESFADATAGRTAATTSTVETTLVMTTWWLNARMCALPVRRPARAAGYFAGAAVALLMNVAL